MGLSRLSLRVLTATQNGGFPTWFGQLRAWVTRPRFARLPRDPEVLANPSLTLPTSETPEVSIVVPVYGKFATTWACLQALSLARTKVTFEVIVVDDKSPDQTLEVLRHVSGLRVVAQPTNQGFIRSCNAGAKVARGRWLCLLNNDTRVQDDWLDELVNTFTREPDAGMVGAKLLFPDGTLQEAGGTVFRDGSASHYGRNRDPGRPEFNFLREVDYCSGACLLLPLADYLAAGGFDEHYLPAYYEDTDLAFKIRRTGKKVLYQPRARVVHYEGITNGRNLKQGVKRYQVVNREKFRVRYADELATYHPAPGRRTLVSADRNLRSQLLVWQGEQPLSRLLRPGVPRALLASGVRPLVFTRSPGDWVAELTGAGVEVTCPPYYASVWELLRGPRGAGVRYLLCPPDVVQLAAEFARLHAPYLKTIVELDHPFGVGLDFAQLAMADLVLVPDSKAAEELGNACPSARCVTGDVADGVLVAELHALASRR